MVWGHLLLNYFEVTQSYSLPLRVFLGLNNREICFLEMLEGRYASVLIQISLNYGLGLPSSPIKEFAAELACVSKGIKCLGSVRCLQWDHLLAVLLPSAVPCSAGSRLCKAVCTGVNYIWEHFCLKILVSSLCCVNFQRLCFCHFVTVSQDFSSIAELCSVVTIIDTNNYYIYTYIYKTVTGVLTFSSSSGAPCWLMHLHAGCSWVGLE